MLMQQLTSHARLTMVHFAMPEVQDRARRATDAPIYLGCNWFAPGQEVHPVWTVGLADAWQVVQSLAQLARDDAAQQRTEPSTLGAPAEAAEP